MCEGGFGMSREWEYKAKQIKVEAKARNRRARWGLCLTFESIISIKNAWEQKAWEPPEVMYEEVDDSGRGKKRYAETVTFGIPFSLADKVWNYKNISDI